MPALYKGRPHPGVPHLRPVPEQSDGEKRLKEFIAHNYLIGDVLGMRQTAMDAAGKAMLTNPKAARHLSRAVTHLNEALEALK